MKKKIISSCLLILIFCIYLTGCNSSGVPLNVKKRIIEHAEKTFNQSVEIVSLDIVERSPAEVQFMLKLEDGFEFPGRFTAAKSALFPAVWEYHIFYKDVEQKILNNWSEIKALADTLNVTLDTPQFVEAGINPLLYHYHYLDIVIESKDQFNAIAEFIVATNSLLDFTWTSNSPIIGVVLHEHESSVTISSFYFDTFHYLDPWTPGIKNRRYEKRQRLTDPHVIVESLENGWAREVERGTITEDGNIIQRS